MTDRKKKRIERVKLLDRQILLNRDNCEVCPHKNDTGRKECMNCETYIELREIGRTLVNGEEFDENKKIPKINKAVDEKGKSKSIPFGKSSKHIDKHLGVKGYLERKERSYKDSEIAEQIGVNYSALKNWKSLKGLTIKRGKNR